MDSSSVDGHVVYEVLAQIDDSDRESFARYMTMTHIPAVIATGLFIGAEFEQADELRFRTRYLAASQSHLDTYLSEHAAGLRQDFLEHFPHARVSRTIWQRVSSHHQH